MKISKRERVLLIIAGTLVLGYLLLAVLLLPALKGLQDARAEKENLSMQKVQMMAGIESLPANQKTHDELVAAVKARQVVHFDDGQENTAIVALVTTLCNGHGLTPRSLTVGDRSPLMPPGNTNSGDQAGAQTVYVVNSAPVTVSLTGSFDQIRAMAFDLLKGQQVRIRSLSFDSRSNNAQVVFQVFLQVPLSIEAK